MTDTDIAIKSIEISNVNIYREWAANTNDITSAKTNIIFIKEISFGMEQIREVNIMVMNVWYNFLHRAWASNSYRQR